MLRKGTTNNVISVILTDFFAKGHISVRTISVVLVSWAKTLT